jgi:hypothetical protein
MNEIAPEYTTEERANGLDVLRDGFPVQWVRREYFPALLAALLEAEGAVKVGLFMDENCIVTVHGMDGEAPEIAGLEPDGVEVVCRLLSVPEDDNG